MKYSLGQLELGGHLNNLQGSKPSKDTRPLGPTTAHEVAMLCEDGACEAAGKDLVQGQKWCFSKCLLSGQWVHAGLQSWPECLY